MSKNFKPNGFMVDLEFADKSESSAIMQIAIVPIDTVTMVYETDKSKCLFLHVDPDDCVKHGMTIGIDTIKWWIKQDQKVLQNAFDLNSKEYKHPLPVALAKVTNFISQFFQKDDTSMQIFQRGDKDSAILNYAYNQVFKYDAPWKFWDVRCIRILENVFQQFKPDTPKNTHNALSDALNQADWLCQYMRHAVSLETGKPKSRKAVEPVADVPQDDDL